MACDERATNAMTPVVPAGDWSIPEDTGKHLSGRRDPNPRPSPGKVMRAPGGLPEQRRMWSQGQEARGKGIDVVRDVLRQLSVMSLDTLHAAKVSGSAHTLPRTPRLLLLTIFSFCLFT